MGEGGERRELGMLSPAAPEKGAKLMAPMAEAASPPPPLLLLLLSLLLGSRRACGGEEEGMRLLRRAMPSCAVDVALLPLLEEDRRGGDSPLPGPVGRS